MEATNGKETDDACEIPNRIGKNNIINYGSFQPPPACHCVVCLHGLAQRQRHCCPGAWVARGLRGPRPHPGTPQGASSQRRGRRDARTRRREGAIPSLSCPARARHCSQGPCRSTQKWLWRSGPSWAGQGTPGVRGKGAAGPWTVAWRDPELRVTSARARRGGREAVPLRTPIGTAFRLCQMQGGRSQG